VTFREISDTTEHDPCLSDESRRGTCFFTDKRLKRFAVEGEESGNIGKITFLLENV